MTTRNRIRELRTVRAGELSADPRNWREHPPEQRQALQSMLERVGFVDAVIARETPDGLVLVDGHLRADLDADAEIPVLVVDLDEAEAGEVLASFDPLSAMAQTNVEALGALLGDLPPMPDALELPSLPKAPAPPSTTEPHRLRAPAQRTARHAETAPGARNDPVRYTVRAVGLRPVPRLRLDADRGPQPRAPLLRHGDRPGLHRHDDSAVRIAYRPESQANPATRLMAVVATMCRWLPLPNMSRRHRPDTMRLCPRGPSRT